MSEDDLLIKSSQYSKLSRHHRYQDADAAMILEYCRASPEGYEGFARSSCREK